jgi:hypothetical protein
MEQGRLIQCDTPAALKSQLPVVCYEVAGSGLRGVREPLGRVPGVLTVEPTGAVLHAFADPSVPIELLQDAAPGTSIRAIAPSLEDVFIAHIRRSQRAA